ncbi:peroxidase-like [Diorhabda carinulata]|uniref:peroxidase-like n=1 Tax=Diorhabda carinulata TaxID=1163345 RepID=UPI0025A0F708|nr:peroxidase-like [Diorhabda carinulata]XP_057663247.1 peroxidase-like [Diorhabda carinulata]
MRNLLLQFLLISVSLQSYYSLLPPPFKDSKLRKKKISSNFKLTKEDVEDAINFSLRYVKKLEGFEQSISWPSRIEPGTPVHGLFLSQAPDLKAIERGRQALVATKASAQLAYTCCHESGMTLETCSNSLIQSNFLQSSLNESCSYLIRKCIVEEASNKYRSMNGTCNHVTKASIGEAFSAYERLLDADYLNFFDVPKRSVTKMPLPSARKISTDVVTVEKDPLTSLTVAFTVFGQFIEHDLSQFASSVMMNFNNSFSCCDVTGFDMAPRYRHPFCMSVSVPDDDIFYSKRRVECISYTRSFPAMRSDCSMGYLEQQNQATHYLDGSQIYGNYLEKSMQLRSKQKGKLNTNDNNLLPFVDEPKQKCQVHSETDTCFVSGDPRVNMHPQLSIMYTIWVREHNRIAEALSKINPDWDDELLFQEARRIVIAEMQHITYQEWLKNLLDEKYIHSIEKNPEYSEDINPSVSNEFATSAIRFLQAMFSGNISVVNRERVLLSILKLSDHFNKPGVITQENMFDYILRGMATGLAHKVGVNHAKDYINEFLTDENYGYDLLSIDIQRGRDHGLPSYTFYRQHCGLPKATLFKDFLDVMSNETVQAISKVYSHVDDVDLLIGGLLEQPVKNSQLGPTFSCIIGDQFYRTRRGDRYFYTSTNQPTPFSESQAAEIEKVSLARIFCDNSNIDKIQRKVFEQVSPSNPLTSCTCDRMLEIDLNLWKDTTEKNSTS